MDPAGELIATTFLNKFVFIFGLRQGLCSPGLPGALRDMPVSPSQVLGLKACTKY